MFHLKPAPAQNAKHWNGGGQQRTTDRGGVQCPICERHESRVTDSRMSGPGIRRRRECTCGYRFTTYEYAVIKSAIDFQI